MLNQTKANVKDFDELREGLDYMRTENVFKDMTSLIDTMTKNFEVRVEQERQQTTNIFSKLLEEQKAVTGDIE